MDFRKNSPHTLGGGGDDCVEVDCEEDPKGKELWELAHLPGKKF